jgi:hypothetical protein
MRTPTDCKESREEYLYLFINVVLALPQVL